MDKEPQIKINETGEVQIKIPDTGGSLSVEDVKKDTDSKFKDINYILLSVVIILLVMVATLIIDSFHFNSAIYKEYSEKTALVEDTQKMNETLLNQIKDLSEQNKQEMETIKQFINK